MEELWVEWNSLFASGLLVKMTFQTVWSVDCWFVFGGKINFFFFFPSAAGFLILTATYFIHIHVYKICICIYVCESLGKNSYTREKHLEKITLREDFTQT